MTPHEWEYLWSVIPLLAKGALITIEATILGMAIALILGLIVTLIRLSRIPVLGAVMTSAVVLIRNTPLLTQLFFLFYVFPEFGLNLPAMAVGVLGLGIHYAAYTSEVFRAGLEGVPRGQWEASAALNMSTADALRLIIVPQAVPPMIPALGNYMIGMFKETAILATITIADLFGQAKLLAADSFLILPLYTSVALVYLALSFGGSVIVRRVEKSIANRSAVRIRTI